MAKRPRAALPPVRLRPDWTLLAWPSNDPGPVNPFAESQYDLRIHPHHLRELRDEVHPAQVPPRLLRLLDELDLQEGGADSQLDPGSRGRTLR